MQFRNAQWSKKWHNQILYEHSADIKNMQPVRASVGMKFILNLYLADFFGHIYPAGYRIILCARFRHFLFYCMTHRFSLFTEIISDGPFLWLMLGSYRNSVRCFSAVSETASARAQLGSPTSLWNFV